MRLSLQCVFFFMVLSLGCAKSQNGGVEQSSGMVLLNAVDFMGGDLKHLKAPGGASECAEACSKLKDCHAFTFAQASHANPKKHLSCWLKKKGFRYNRASHYISGIKP